MSYFPLYIKLQKVYGHSRKCMTFLQLLYFPFGSNLIEQHFLMFADVK